MIDRIIINSDAKIFKEIAKRFEVDFYHRPQELGTSETKSDEVVNDFINQYPCDMIAWVNPIAPLQSGTEIKSIRNNTI